ncbi:hypothetical protein [Azospirillum argentinense]|uniref:hypothetical protein n=1 Tax=Azospirillum argentinense TaxID=2970906 RepID=UPI00190BFB25|nr:hypothetical protein [Azospirillum argentinense]
MTDTVPAFLNVAHSLSGKRWQARPYDERLAWGTHPPPPRNPPPKPDPPRRPGRSSRR